MEQGADGQAFRPPVKLYSRSQLHELMKDFRETQVTVVHYQSWHLPLVGRLIPASWDGWIAKRWGWYVIASSTK